MEEVILTLILSALEAALKEAIEGAIKYVIKKVVDSTGRVITKIVYYTDSDGDGVDDLEHDLFSFDLMIPDLSDGYCIVNDGDEIGVGLPQLRLIDGTEIVDYLPENVLLDNVITGNDNGYILDIDGDGDCDDVLVPLPDFTGDGNDDWGWLVDQDDNGLPDASPAAPFYPVGSPEFTYIVEQQQQISGGIIIMSADGTMSVYDPSGQLTEEQYSEAYQLWCKDNGAMVKPFDYYTVSEALLLVIAGFAAVSLIVRLFKRRHYIT